MVTSSFSDTTNCVDVSLIDGPDALSLSKDGVPASVVVRDSKDPVKTTGLVFTAPEWDAFVEGVKAGEFDRERLAAGG